jgi:hypothetical protein
MLLRAPGRIVQAVTGHELLKVHYPYYVPSALVGYGSMVKPNEAIVTDIPWAVAWYANRTAIWLPADKNQLETLRQSGKDRGQPITGLLLSQHTLGAPVSSVTFKNAANWEWRDYILLNPIMKLGVGGRRANEAVQKELINMLMSEMPLKHPYSPDDNLYLFVTENPVIKNENPASGALAR